MKELEGVKKVLGEIKSTDKTIIDEMIKEVELAAKKQGANKRDLLISLHNDINNLVIGEPTNKTFQSIKSRMDEVIISLR